jgi:spore coat polysaccharide biosynthesis protein SpsF
MDYLTDQEEFWAGKFGNKYISRNSDADIIRSNIAMFSRILRSTADISSILELGANIGLNLIALNELLPDLEISAVEINENAVNALQNIGNVKVNHTSILSYQATEKKDLVLTKGVLIHINPEYLQDVYKTMYESSNKYICISEYYNPNPVEVTYRGNEEKLFKRDFAGELLEKYSNLKLVDYGFVYHRDNYFPQDDMTWFLLEKE